MGQSVHGGAMTTSLMMASFIVDMSAIAQRAGVTKHTVNMWRYRHADFPPPLVRLAIGPVWAWPEVKRWLESRGYVLDPV